MRFAWDEAKAAANFDKHRVAFEEVIDFEWEAEAEVVVVDSRKITRNYAGWLYPLSEIDCMCLCIPNVDMPSG